MAPLQSLLGLGSGVLPGLAAPMGAAIRSVDEKLPRVLTGVVESDLVDPKQTRVQLDSDPSSTSVRAPSLSGALPRLTRVFLLRYPPHGLITLGAEDELDLVKLTKNIILNSGNLTLTSGIMRLFGGTDASLSSTGHPFQIGEDTGSNLRMDSNEIMAISNGAISTLFLQNDGGSISSPALRPQQLFQGGAFNTSSTAFVAMGTGSMTGEYPSTGSLRVYVNSLLSNTGNFVAVSTYEIRDTDVSGTVRFAASNSECARATGIVSQQQGAHYSVITGLPTSGPYFIRPMMRTTNAGNTATFTNNFLAVEPVT